MAWRSWIRSVLRSLDEEPTRSLVGFQKEPKDIVQTNIYFIHMDNSNNYGPRIEGNLTVKGNVTDAFKVINNIGAAADPKKQELSTRLKKLHVEVQQLIEALPPEKAEVAEVAARDLKSFVEEAASKQPRKPNYEITGSGLLEAAKSVTSMVAPITTAVKAVLDLLTP